MFTKFLNSVLLIGFFVALNNTLVIVSQNHPKNQSLYLWQNLSLYANNWSKDFVAIHKSFVEEVVQSSNVSHSCSQSISATLEAIDRLEDWSLLMANSWPTIPPIGIFEGTVTDLGAYDQCLAIVDNEVLGSAQYCLLDFKFPLPEPMAKQHNLFHQINDLLPANNSSQINTTNNALNIIAKEASIFYWISLRLGICTPNKCNTNDISTMAKYVSAKSGVQLKSVNCELKSKLSLKPIHVFAILFILIFCAMCTLGTVCDAITNFKKNSNGYTFIKIFSLNQSVHRLLAPTLSSDLSCIHGIRVLSILWILYGHTIQWNNHQLSAQSFYGKHLLTQFMAQPLLNGEYGIVTFLLISAILTTYICLTVTNNNRKNFSIIGYIVLRLARLWPQLMIFILLTFLLPLIGSGPVWSEVVGDNVSKCMDNWWLNMLFIHNLYRSDRMCAIHTWFIALDYQYHIIAILIVLAFLANKKLGITLNVIFIMTFLVISSTLWYVYELPPALINTGRTEYFEQYFSFTIHKIPGSYGTVYFIGTLVGYVIYANKSIKINKTCLTLIWTTILLAYCMPLWDKVYWMYGRHYTPLVGTIGYQMFQLIWSVCTSLMIWLCVSGNGGLVNQLLSMKPFIPLGRLTYSVYLCHAWLIWYYVGTRRHLTDVSQYNILINFTHITVMSYITGFIFYVLFESPIIELQKH
ncbi:nose resistant to fluoxetine protein 6-like [Oppia nitens]|uniref:nose resistant to fluoxetine protein 6-like n=1 Tax=Oppia nitens TaxID=1686743 RepID=UPI0023DA6A96|nr:nose resistant to fluoxetine protein 6-like [Oppia nitens]